MCVCPSVVWLVGDSRDKNSQTKTMRFNHVVDFFLYEEEKEEEERLCTLHTTTVQQLRVRVELAAAATTMTSV